MIADSQKQSEVTSSLRFAFSFFRLWYSTVHPGSAPWVPILLSLEMCKLEELLVEEVYEDSLDELLLFRGK
ncbi:hypothetical protein [Paenisporosarcina sp. NPDC076898]|uniref:hypothetical protein n=1 Tax=unclassified Paenisporosarcina TaxID=2642018 RepID=UPI003D008D61